MSKHAHVAAPLLFEGAFRVKNRHAAWLLSRLLQRAYIYLLEYDPLVLHYKEQPFSIPYYSGMPPIAASLAGPQHTVCWESFG